MGRGTRPLPAHPLSVPTGDSVLRLDAKDALLAWQAAAIVSKRRRSVLYRAPPSSQDPSRAP